MRRLLVIGLLVALLFGIVRCADLCLKSKQKEPEGYRVVGYDAKTCTYEILSTQVRAGVRQRKRLTVRCYLYGDGASHVGGGLQDDWPEGSPCMCTSLKFGDHISGDPHAPTRISDDGQYLTVETGTPPMRDIYQIVRSEILR